MSEQSRRPTLRLKTEVKPRTPSFVRPAPPAPPPQPRWKCRPCGSAFDLPADLPEDESVRCPSCRARLGKPRDFRADPPDLTKLRARPAPAKPAPTGR